MTRTKTKYPPGWNEARVRRVLARYESQTDAEAVAEDEAAYEASGQTMMNVPRELVSAVRNLIARAGSSSRRPTGRGRRKKTGTAAHAKSRIKRSRSL